jgi:hypothetical protein
MITSISLRLALSDESVFVAPLSLPCQVQWPYSVDAVSPEARNNDLVLRPMCWTLLMRVVDFKILLRMSPSDKLVVTETPPKKEVKETEERLYIEKSNNLQREQQKEFTYPQAQRIQIRIPGESSATESGPRVIGEAL